MRLADETVVAASEADIFLFPPQKGNSVSKCGVLKSEFLGTFVSIDKSAPSGADGRKDIVHGANQSDNIKNKP